MEATGDDKERLTDNILRLLEQATEEQANLTYRFLRGIVR